MILEFDIDFNQVEAVKTELAKLGVSIISSKTNSNGNQTFKVIADSKHQVLAIVSLYFG